jgi:hypothetical protein
MILRCIRAFGHFEPGDEVPVPDDKALFDHYYFERVELEDDKGGDKE